MLTYTIRRLLYGLLVLLGVNLAMMRLSGRALVVAPAEKVGATDATIASIPRPPRPADAPHFGSKDWNL